MEITRREFLKLLGFSAAGAAGGIWAADAILSIPDAVFERAAAGPHIETWKNSICSACPGGCGIRVRLIDEIPVRITGNALYPVNRGAVCPMAEAGVESLFHPDRVRQPLKRAGGRGEDKWMAISWEEALGLLSSRLRQLRESGTPEKLVFVGRDYNDMMTDFVQAFMQAFGSPNFLWISHARINALPSLLTHGWDGPVAYDLLNSDLVLNFGGSVLDEEPSPVRFNQFYAALRSRKSPHPGRIVHVDSYMSRTAIHSSEWIPIKPGSMAALALGIAHVMIKDQSYDQDFVENHTFGFSNWQDSAGRWHQGFKALVDDDYYPERVADLTNVPAKRIVGLARDFAAAQPALAIAGGQAAAGTNSLYTLWAIYSLNALKGNFQKPGGLWFPKAMRKKPPQGLKQSLPNQTEMNRAKIGRRERHSFSFAVDSLQDLARSLRDNDPYPIDTLIFYRADPLFESTNRRELAAALQKVPFIVNCTPFVDETASFADLILPDHVFLEKWEISRSIPTIEFSHMGVQQPVVAPLYDTRHTGDVLLQIAQRLGDSVGASLPWDSYKAYLQDCARGIFNSGEGTIISQTVELSWIEFLKKRGWQVFEYSTFDEFWQLLLEKGGWWDPLYPDSALSRVLKTRSGRFEFFSQRLRDEIEKFVAAAPAQAGSPEQFRDVLRRWKIEATEDRLYLPHFEHPRFGRESVEYPYHLLCYQILTTREGVGVRSTLSQELFGLHMREYWNTWVEINPATAKREGIDEGDYVSIVSPKGSLQLKAKLLPTVMPEVVMVPFGLGHRTRGHLAAPTGSNPYEIFADDADSLSGIASLISTKVRIEKIEASGKEA